MVKIGKFIGRLLVVGLFGSWFVFTIWGIVTWNQNLDSLITNKTTIALLYVPLFIGMFILFVVALGLGLIGNIDKRRKEKKKEEEFSFKDFDGIPSDWKEKFTKFVEKIEKEAEK